MTLLCLCRRKGQSDAIAPHEGMRTYAFSKEEKGGSLLAHKEGGKEKAPFSLLLFWLVLITSLLILLPVYPPL